MREFTNLAWPTSPYSSAHRPIPRRTRLLTGIAIGNQTWATVHVPLQPGRLHSVDTACLGIHAAHQEDPLDPGIWQVLDRILLAGRIQATALAGLDLPTGLAHVRDRLEEHTLRVPGAHSLIVEWPAPTAGPVPRASGARAQLLELSAADLPPGAAALLAQNPPPTQGSVDQVVADAVAHAAAIALAGAVWAGCYLLSEDLDLRQMLDIAIGDQLPVRDLFPHTGSVSTGTDEE